MALQERLLLLNGRLELALSQVELRSATVPRRLSSKQVKSGGDKEKKGVTRYVEGESSDDEKMEIDVEEGDDTGDVEDIGLGGKSYQQNESDEESAEESSEEGEESGSEEEDDDETDEEDEDEDEDEDGGPRLNGFIDDEAEESWGSEEDSEEDE